MQYIENLKDYIQCPPHICISYIRTYLANKFYTTTRHIPSKEKQIPLASKLNKTSSNLSIFRKLYFDVFILFFLQSFGACRSWKAGIWISITGDSPEWRRCRNIMLVDIGGDGLRICLRQIPNVDLRRWGWKRKAFSENADGGATFQLFVSLHRKVR